MSFTISPTFLERKGLAGVLDVFAQQTDNQPKITVRYNDNGTYKSFAEAEAARAMLSKLEASKEDVNIIAQYKRINHNLVEVTAITKSHGELVILDKPMKFQAPLSFNNDRNAINQEPLDKFIKKVRDVITKNSRGKLRHSCRR